jgi:hypothetical protein
LARPAKTTAAALTAGVGAAVALGVAGLVSLAPATERPDSGAPAVVVRADDGTALTRVSLAPGRGFAIGYRNSIYGSVAEDRYTARPGGRFRLVQIAADERAVIEEYYALPGPDRADAGDRRRWVTDPGRPAVFGELTIAATDLGRRTLHVPGHRPVPLWRLVTDDDPIVVLDIEET